MTGYSTAAPSSWRPNPRCSAPTVTQGAAPCCSSTWDDFKVVNDTYGHAVGDTTLDNVVRRVQSTLREVDTVGRLGGDEFGILLDEVRTRKTPS